MTCGCGKDHADQSGHGWPDPKPGQIALSGTITCNNAEQLKTVLEQAPKHVALSRQEPGCLFFEINQTDDPMVWSVEELYEDQAGLDAHKKRLAASEWASKTTELTRDIHRIDG